VFSGGVLYVYVELTYQCVPVAVDKCAVFSFACASCVSE
jgi:hypothetical protein